MTLPIIAPEYLLPAWLNQEMSAAGEAAKKQGGLSEDAKIALGVGGGLLGLGAIIGGIVVAVNASNAAKLAAAATAPAPSTSQAQQIQTMAPDDGGPSMSAPVVYQTPSPYQPAPYPTPVSRTDPFGIGRLQSPYATYSPPPPPDPFGTGNGSLRSPVSQSAQAFAPPSTFIPSLTLSPQFASTPAPPPSMPPPSMRMSSSIPSLSASIPSLHMSGCGWYSPYPYGGKDL